MYDAYGADTFRLYEMSMGPLDASRPWETRAVVGSQRFLQRLWRNVVDEETGELRVVDEPRRRRDAPAAAPHHRRGPHRHGRAALQHRDRPADRAEQPRRQGRRRAPRRWPRPLVLMVAPLAPHLAEELWSRLGHDELAGLRAVPGRPTRRCWSSEHGDRGRAGRRARCATGSRCRPSIGEDELRELALASEAVQRALDGRAVRTVVVRAPRLVNVVPAWPAARTAR